MSGAITGEVLVPWADYCMGGAFSWVVGGDVTWVVLLHGWCCYIVDIAFAPVMLLHGCGYECGYVCIAWVHGAITWVVLLHGGYCMVVLLHGQCYYMGGAVSGCILLWWYHYVGDDAITWVCLCMYYMVVAITGWMLHGWPS